MKCLPYLCSCMVGEGKNSSPQQLCFSLCLLGLGQYLQFSGSCGCPWNKLCGVLNSRVMCNGRERVGVCFVNSFRLFLLLVFAYFFISASHG